MRERPSLILATSNGTGMGHLARQLAIARSAFPRARVTLFSLSAALPTAASEDIPGEYCPGPDRRWMPEVTWPHYLAGRLQALGREVGADVVVFDGVAPYRGITLARARMPDTAFVWFRRGMWREGVNAGQLWKSGLFDRVIEPGDMASDSDRGPTADRDDALRVSPVSLLEVVDRPGREAAASELGIDPDLPTLLLTLGTGRLGDVSSPGATILETARGMGSWQICVATSAIAESTVHAGGHDRVVELRGVFPLARYLNAFDAVVSAAGYNAVHEYLPAGLPTLLVPNRLTRTDDQVGRAAFLARSGLALSVTDDTPEELAHQTSLLLQESTRAALRRALAEFPREKKTGGAAQTAEALTALAGTFEPQPPTLRRRALRARDDFKEALKRRLGPQGTNTVRRLLGRAPIESSGRLRVSTGPPSAGVRRLIYSSDPSVELLLGEDVVEHILPGASNGYLSARQLLVDRHYDVVNPR